MVKRHDVCKLLSRGLGRVDRKRQIETEIERGGREGGGEREGETNEIKCQKEVKVDKGYTCIYTLCYLTFATFFYVRTFF